MSHTDIRLNKEVLSWLLEDSHPSIRYFTLTTLLENPPTSAIVKKTRSEIMKHGRVPEILSDQHPDGYWGDIERIYTPKRRATVWRFFALVDHGADTSDTRIANTIEFILTKARHRESGAFSANTHEYMMKYHPHQSDKWFLPVPDNKGGSSMVLTCFTGQLLSSLIRAGYLDDSRVQQAIDWIVTYQRFDDGEIEPPDIWPYNTGGNPNLRGNQTGKSCWGKHTCHTGAAWILRAFSEIPEKNRSEGVRRVIQEGVEFFLRHQIFKQDDHQSKIVNPTWTELGYPHMDLLHVLSTLTRLGVRDKRMNEAIDMVIQKQTGNGKWIADVAGYEGKGQASKWVTLNALSTLKQLDL